ncbi:MULTISPECIES: formylglycine-generating enzyme family protein [Sphaerospermopsis]|uniref:Formylglycine-generating enzyme family protein n=1 Tax=Sphaerospermopsis torques-reginae ITEP-024 TaxID=984208 RepID=A0ABX8X2N7_9CYAN|nr:MULTISPECIES: formylglycine-generating enzyme family protein [Sphaerospermopsis]MBE9057595.1 formylglycine-generating enzyme family protein [Sphaerospermopsis sp. LEGE 08334]QYX32963.1 formylglycine-generating enzyme family protein [Sphaerospermopsis torques-reginae ITEP-024]
MRFLILLLIQVVALISLFTNSPAFAVNPCPPGMVMISGGTFKMGADDSGFEKEQTAENVTVTSFCIDKYEVTNAQFTEFVKATNYVTVAERPLSKQQFPDLSDEERLPGSLVFQMPKPGVKRVQLLSWWHWTPGANWQHPFGSDSTIVGKENYPVVHIAYEDALAYAQWVGKSLPTEGQWEYAARGGLEGATYTWGNQYSAKKANTWQGIFPFFNTKADGYVGTAKVGSFPPNGYGLYDMTGNVWEWTSDLFNDRSPTSQRSGGSVNQSFDPKKPTETALHVIKGGSYLCAPNYCSRYRPAARESESPDTGTTHIGFRLVKNLTR